MSIFLTIILSVVFYIAMAGVTHGYGKHRWPEKIEYDRSYRKDIDVNEANRSAAAIIWPFYWLFIWPFTKANETAFSFIEKKVARQIAQNKSRIADLQASRAELLASSNELEQAELELEKEIAKGL